VVKEDKAVADAVRRNAAARPSADRAVRLAHQPAEPVAMTAGLRGLGDAAVLLLLKTIARPSSSGRSLRQQMQAGASWPAA
jgi:hypothetical protein